MRADSLFFSNLRFIRKSCSSSDKARRRRLRFFASPRTSAGEPQLNPRGLGGVPMLPESPPAEAASVAPFMDGSGSGSIVIVSIRDTFTGNGDGGSICGSVLGYIETKFAFRALFAGIFSAFNNSHENMSSDKA